MFVLPRMELPPLARCRRCGQETILDGVMAECCSNPDFEEIQEDGQPNVSTFSELMTRWVSTSGKELQAMIPFHCISCGHDSIARVVEEKKPCISHWKGERVHGYGCKKYVECSRCGFTTLINPFGTKPDVKAHDAVIPSATGM